MSIINVSLSPNDSDDNNIVFRTKRNKGHPKIGDIDSVKIGNTNYKISSMVHPDKRFDVERKLLTSYNYLTSEYPSNDIEKSKYILMELLDYGELQKYDPKKRNTIKKRIINKKNKRGGTKKKNNVTIKPLSINMSKYLKDDTALDKMESGNLTIDLSRIRIFDNEKPVNTILRDLRKGEISKGSSLKKEKNEYKRLPRPYDKSFSNKSKKKGGKRKSRKSRKTIK